MVLKYKSLEVEKMNFNLPIFFKRNRVFRVYKGGMLFHDFLGDEKEDNNYPEEWICSKVRAINDGHDDPLEGISISEDGIPFSELIDKHKTEMLGDRKDLGVLVKYLDSAIRLPMQVHPTKDFSRKYFNSNYGKAEAWLILGTREDACIYLGFNREVSKKEFIKAVEESEVNPNIMTSFVNKIPVKTGDVFFVDAGVIHAIGAGCLILEAQEPTDFTIQPEYWCGDYHLNSKEMYLGLDSDVALDCFDFKLHGNQVVEKAHKIPKVINNENNVIIESLISSEDTSCFTMTRYKVDNGECLLQEPASIWIVSDGEGIVYSTNYKRKIKKGDYFFLPYAANNKVFVKSDKNITMICCKGGLEN